jgi:hypothetical protein
MAYDEQLAHRIRQAFGGRHDITERKMFGGLAFLYLGRMCCGMVGRDLMVRVPDDEFDAVMRGRHVRPMDFSDDVLRGRHQRLAVHHEGDELRSAERVGVSEHSTIQTAACMMPIPVFREIFPRQSNTRVSKPHFKAWGLAYRPVQLLGSPDGQRRNYRNTGREVCLAHDMK